jgi:hypothetical protein
VNSKNQAGSGLGSPNELNLVSLRATFVTSVVSFVRASAVLLLAAMLARPLLAQHHADLAPAEIDQLRDAALEPDNRLKLYVKFARARLAALEEVRTNPKITAADRPAQIHDKMQNFLEIYDEMNDNIDMYLDRKNDIRKPLKVIIEADTEFKTRLRAFHDAVAAGKEDTKPYEFIMANSLDTLSGSADDHRQLLAEQEEAAKHKKKNKDRAN